MEDTQLGGSERVFRSTLWTQVLAAKDPASPDRRRALEEWIRIDWKPVYAFLRRRGRVVEAAKDFTQGFFAAFLERDYLQYVDRDRGKFRTFLLTALEHWVADQFEYQKAKKRGGGSPVFSLDIVEAERDLPANPGPSDTPDAVFRKQWALLVLERALKTLQAEFAAAVNAVALVYVGLWHAMELGMPRVSPSPNRAKATRGVRNDLEQIYPSYTMSGACGSYSAMLRIESGRISYRDVTFFPGRPG